jgi:hypothetical protein
MMPGTKKIRTYTLTDKWMDRLIHGHVGRWTEKQKKERNTG